MKEVRMAVEGCSQQWGQYLCNDFEVRDQDTQKSRKVTMSEENSFFPSSQQDQGVIDTQPLSSEVGCC